MKRRGFLKALGFGAAAAVVAKPGEAARELTADERLLLAQKAHPLITVTGTTAADNEVHVYGDGPGFCELRAEVMFREFLVPPEVMRGK